jgi:uroporphyrinogen decarboxylase
MVNEKGSKERILEAIHLKEPDVVPIAPYIGYWFAPKLMGYTISEYVLGKNKFRAEVLLNAQKRFGFDWIMAGGGHRKDWKKNVIITEEEDRYIVKQKKEEYSLGRWQRSLIVPKDDAPYRINGTKGYLPKIEDYEELPITDSQTILDGGGLEQMEIISKRVGNEILVVGHLGSPFVSGVGKVGLQQWIMALYKNPDLVGKVMDQSIEQSIEYAKAEIEAGAEAFYIEECYAGADVISPELYAKFAFPYEQKHIKKLNELGIPTILSFTGDPMPIIDKVIETGPTAHHFEESKKGFTVDIYKIREKLRDKACMFIPFDAINLLPSNDLKNIEKKVVEIISKTADGGGVVLSTGCPVLKDTSEESIDIMTKTTQLVRN